MPCGDCGRPRPIRWKCVAPASAACRKRANRMRPTRRVCAPALVAPCLCRLNSKVSLGGVRSGEFNHTRGRTVKPLNTLPARPAPPGRTRKEPRAAGIRKESLKESLPRFGAAHTGVDSPGFAPIECCLGRGFGRRSRLRGTAVSLIKIIVITLAVILSILFFGRFLF
jgi:hypothetical protein